jgi:hypothetical protein
VGEERYAGGVHVTNDNVFRNIWKNYGTGRGVKRRSSLTVSEREAYAGPTVFKRDFIVRNEQHQPLANVEVELFDRGSGRPVIKTKTDTSGVASFETEVIGAVEDFWARPLLTRGIQGRVDIFPGPKPVIEPELIKDEDTEDEDLEDEEEEILDGFLVSVGFYNSGDLDVMARDGTLLYNFAQTSASASNVRSGLWVSEESIYHAYETGAGTKAFRVTQFTHAGASVRDFDLANMGDGLLSASVVEFEGFIFITGRYHVAADFGVYVHKYDGNTLIDTLDIFPTTQDETPIIATDVGQTGLYLLTTDGGTFTDVYRLDVDMATVWMESYTDSGAGGLAVDASGVIYIEYDTVSEWGLRKLSIDDGASLGVILIPDWEFTIFNATVVETDGDLYALTLSGIDRRDSSGALLDDWADTGSPRLLAAYKF